MDWWTIYSYTRHVRNSVRSSSRSGHFQIGELATASSSQHRLLQECSQHLIHGIGIVYELGIHRMSGLCRAFTYPCAGCNGCNVSW